MVSTLEQKILDGIAAGMNDSQLEDIVAKYYSDIAKVIGEDPQEIRNNQIKRWEIKRKRMGSQSFILGEGALGQYGNEI